MLRARAEAEHGVDGPAEDKGGEEPQRDDVAEGAGDEIGRGAVWFVFRVLCLGV